MSAVVHFAPLADLLEPGTFVVGATFEGPARERYGPSMISESTPSMALSSRLSFAALSTSFCAIAPDVDAQLLSSRARRSAAYVRCVSDACLSSESLDEHLCSQLARRLIRDRSASQFASATEYGADLPPLLCSLVGSLAGEVGRQVVRNVGTDTLAWREEAFPSIAGSLQSIILFFQPCKELVEFLVMRSVYVMRELSRSIQKMGIGDRSQRA